MENSTYIGLSRQVTLQSQMALLANNVANINTPGYKANKPLFEQYVTQPRIMDGEEMAQVYDYGQYKVEAQGALSLTGNDLDVAMDGPGYMMVETGAGTKYTRAGNFTLNNIGELVTPTGYRVLDAGQKPITIPQGARDIRITNDGQISSSAGGAGQLGIVEFDRVQDLRPSGDGFYTTEALGQPALNTKARQGMLEGSNVQAVLEMTEMIEISRKYQSINRMMQSEHDRQRTVIQKLTEV
jgi:flagellar basal-body rod protein FlgF